MKLTGILDFSLGNFLCLRGLAPMGTLYNLSEPDPSIQRDLLRHHRDEMVAFLSEGEYLFFPEVILCSTLSHGDQQEKADQLYRTVQLGVTGLRSLRFEDYRISLALRRTRHRGESRLFEVLRTATVDVNDSLAHKFSRIDGNHRLSATPENPKFRDYKTPFCLILFRNETEAKRFSRILFHNINYKQIPLTMEQNLQLILDEHQLFPDDKLKTDASLGWPYYLARKLHDGLDFDLLANLRPFIEKEPRTFLIRQFTFLQKKGVLGENENAIKRYKEALGRVNAVFDTWPPLKESENQGLLAALVYYELQPSAAISSFVRWVLENHLHLIERSSAPDMIQIFDKVLASKKRRIFVSMPFGKDERTENHYLVIERVCKEINDDHELRPALKVERVDWFHDGTSYVITDKIAEMMSDCGLLIGNLTGGNVNVYHEIGWVMGKAKAEGKDTANMLLFLEESALGEADNAVGFNLRGVKQLRFRKTEEFARELRKNIELFFKLQPDQQTASHGAKT